MLYQWLFLRIGILLNCNNVCAIISRLHPIIKQTIVETEWFSSFKGLAFLSHYHRVQGSTIKLSISVYGKVRGKIFLFFDKTFFTSCRFTHPACPLLSLLTYLHKNTIALDLHVKRLSIKSAVKKKVNLLWRQTLRIHGTSLKSHLNNFWSTYRQYNLWFRFKTSKWYLSYSPLSRWCFS